MDNKNNPAVAGAVDRETAIGAGLAAYKPFKTHSQQVTAIVDAVLALRTASPSQPAAEGEKRNKLADAIEADPGTIMSLDMGAVEIIICALRASPADDREIKDRIDAVLSGAIAYGKTDDAEDMAREIKRQIDALFRQQDKQS